MSVIADLKLGEEAVPLSLPDEGDVNDPIRIFGGIPAQDGTVLYLCLESTEPELFHCLSEDPAVSRVESVATDSDYQVLAVTIPASSSWFLAELDSADIALLQGVGTDGEWHFQLRFADRESLTALGRRCTSRDIPISVIRRYQPVDRPESSRYALTPTQRETLRAAEQAGYFEVPRETTVTELGELLGVSDTAVSQRLRRGLATLVAEALATDQTE